MAEFMTSHRQVKLAAASNRGILISAAAGIGGMKEALPLRTGPKPYCPLFRFGGSAAASRRIFRLVTMTSVPEGQKSLHGDVLQLFPLISGKHFTKRERYCRELTVQLSTRRSYLINLSEHLVILRWILINEIPELSFFTFKA